MSRVIWEDVVPPLPSDKTMSTTYDPIGIVVLSGSCSSAISSLLVEASKVRKDEASVGIVTVTVTTSPVLGSEVAGRVYDQGVGVLVFTIV